MEISKDIFKITSEFPETEKYGLTSQMRRSSVSLPSNIAEGAGRNSNKEFIRFLEIAYASSYELETQLILAESFAYINNETLEILEDKIVVVQKMIFNFIKHLKS